MGKGNHHNYDAAIINGIWGLHLISSWYALRNAGTPYFVFCHGMLDPWFNRKFPLKRLKKLLVWSWGIYPALKDADAVLFYVTKKNYWHVSHFGLMTAMKLLLTMAQRECPIHKQIIQSNS